MVVKGGGEAWWGGVVGAEEGELGAEESEFGARCGGERDRGKANVTCDPNRF